jgi:hypothetical protein
MQRPYPLSIRSVRPGYFVKCIHFALKNCVEARNIGCYYTSLASLKRGVVVMTLTSHPNLPASVNAEAGQRRKVIICEGGLAGLAIGQLTYLVLGQESGS